METPGNNQVPIQCRSGCGFYGNPATEGLCSKCYKDMKDSKNQSSPSMSSSHHTIDAQSPSCVDTAVPTMPVVMSPSASQEGACANSAEDSAAAEQLEQPSTSDESSKKKNRCGICKKKVGLTGFGCRCGGLYCSIHRYSDKHQCSFDYKTHGADEIRKSNPVIKAAKIQHI